MGFGGNWDLKLTTIHNDQGSPNSLDLFAGAFRAYEVVRDLIDNKINQLLKEIETNFRGLK